MPTATTPAEQPIIVDSEYSDYTTYAFVRNIGSDFGPYHAPIAVLFSESIYQKLHRVLAAIGLEYNLDDITVSSISKSEYDSLVS